MRALDRWGRGTKKRERGLLGGCGGGRVAKAKKGKSSGGGQRTEAREAERVSDALQVQIGVQGVSLPCDFRG